MSNKLYILFYILILSLIVFLARELTFSVLAVNTKSNTELKSPLGRFSFLADNLWFPKEFNKNSNLAVSAKAAYFVDINSGEVFFEKNPHLRLPIASLVKIMTVIVSLEEGGSFDRQLIVSSQAADAEPDKMLLKSGEKLTLSELLDGIFLVSANDAAEVLAEDIVGRREEFINLMNSKATQLGMKDSLFINPTGLQEDNVDQYSSAYDVLLMARYAVKKWPELVKISSQPHIYLPESSFHQDYDLYSGINLLTTYPGVVGFKTGYTPEAGLTLVTLANQKGREVMGVLLGSENRRDDAKRLLDYSFQ